MWSRCRVRASSRSCNSPTAATCAKRSSAPSSCAATTAGRPTTRRSLPRRCGCAPSAPSLLGFADFAHYRLDDAMAKTPEAVRDLLDTVWAPARSRALADRDALQDADPGGRRQFQAGAVGLALLRGKAAPAALRFRRGRDQAVSEPRAHDRGGVLHGAAPVRAQLPAAQRRAGLASRRARLGGARPRRRADRAVLRRLLRAAVKAQRRMDDFAARPGKACRRRPPADRQRLQLLQGRRRRADAA